MNLILIPFIFLIHIHPSSYVEEWFKSLMIPETNISCCDTSDGNVLKPGEWKVNKEGYWVKVKNDWYKVPSKAILKRADNPTGGPVAFFRYGKIVCFIRPTEV